MKFVQKENCQIGKSFKWATARRPFIERQKPNKTKRKEAVKPFPSQFPFQTRIEVQEAYGKLNSMPLNENHTHTHTRTITPASNTLLFGLPHANRVILINKELATSKENGKYTKYRTHQCMYEYIPFCLRIHISRYKILGLCSIKATNFLFFLK